MTSNETSEVFLIINCHLFRFFSPEVLAQAQSGSAPAMPPLPTQKVRIDNFLLAEFSYHSKVNTTLWTLHYNILDDAGPNLGRDRAPGSCGPNLSQDTFQESPPFPPDNVTLQHITSPGSMQLSPRWHLSV